jgi:hypothetical protein
MYDYRANTDQNKIEELKSAPKDAISFLSYEHK